VEILSLVAAGLRDKEIATSLRLTPSTVHRHIANLYRKIDVHGRAEATAFALREGIVT
jgi:DNA-binding NarL/FixJ family response regulator